MKKKGLLVFCLTLGLVMANVGIAMAFTHDNSALNTAEVVVGGTEEADMTVTIKNVSNNAVVTQIGWTGIMVGSSGWEVADQYIQIDATSTYAGYGIQIYTNNTSTAAPVANPVFTGSGSPAGLVGVTDTAIALPMAWHAEDDVTTWGTSPEDPVFNGATFDNGYLWQPDIAEGTFVNGDDYVTIWNSGGIRYSYDPGARSSASSPIVVYLGADFTSASVQTYRSSTITLEQYHQ